MAGYESRFLSTQLLLALVDHSSKEAFMIYLYNGIKAMGWIYFNTISFIKISTKLGVLKGRITPAIKASDAKLFSYEILRQFHLRTY